MTKSIDGKATSWGMLFWLCVLIGIGTFFFIYEARGVERSYEQIATQLDKPQYRGQVKTVELPGTANTLNVPNWGVFKEGNIWSLVSGASPLSESFTPTDLTNVSMAQGDAGTTMQLSRRIEDPLKRLFSDSESAGMPLMISSAYRSIADQQTIYNKFVTSRGQAAADTYVADPGASEHHTGLAIDLASASDDCAADSDTCTLGFDAIAWLAENSHRYGFIVRYPEGKQPITGVAYEPWHYRYVGVPMATAIYESNLTLDEALIQIYPAFQS